MEEINRRTRAFLSKYFGNRELQDHEDIFSFGHINSLFAMQLVMFIEEEFGIRIDNQDLDLDNFRSIHAISRLVSEKTGFVGE